MPIDANFPSPLRCLFTKKRYKILHGGRGGGRSWGVARCKLIQGVQTAQRVLCAREFQNSIADSVHKLLADQISALGMNYLWDVQQNRIIGANGSSFAFEGIKNNTTRIKSYEGIDSCWVEEAVKVTRSSWGILLPTIRKPNSDIIATLNLELDTDYTNQRFILNPDLRKCIDPDVCGPNDDVMESSDSYVVKMTYKDNPYFPDVLRAEMEADKKRDYDYYLHVWEGHTIQQLEGAVYAKELRRATEEGRICDVRWDREQPVHTFWDLGRADRTAIWFAQRVAMQYRIIDYFEDSGEDITYYLKELQRREYTYGQTFLPHDAKAKKLGSKRSVEEITRHYGFDVRVVPKLSVVDGINAARIIFPNCYFDKIRCQEGVDRLRHYRFRVVDGHLSNEPLHDDASDGADAFRYLAVGFKSPSGNKTSIGERLSLAAAALRGEVEIVGADGRRPDRAQSWMS